MSESDRPSARPPDPPAPARLHSTPIHPPPTNPPPTNPPTPTHPRQAVAARNRLQELVSGRSKLTVPVTAEQLATLASHGDSNWKKIREDFAVSVDLDNHHGALVIQGAVMAVSRAKVYLYQVRV